MSGTCWAFAAAGRPTRPVSASMSAAMVMRCFMGPPFEDVGYGALPAAAGRVPQLARVRAPTRTSCRDGTVGGQDASRIEVRMLTSDMSLAATGVDGTLARGSRAHQRAPTERSDA